MDFFERETRGLELPEICKSCEARHKGICSNLADIELLYLSKWTEQVDYPAGTELLSQDHHVETYANLLKGVVKLSKLTDDGRQQIVGLQFAPDFLGRPFSDVGDVSAVAATDVRVCEFPRETLATMMEKAPGLTAMLHRQALVELEDAREWMLTLGRRSATEKLALFILDVALHTDPEADIDYTHERRVEIPLSRADIADFLGLTVETVSRTLTRLMDDGVLRRLGKRHVAVKSLAALKAIAHAG